LHATDGCDVAVLNDSVQVAEARRVFTFIFTQDLQSGVGVHATMDCFDYSR